MPVHAAFAQVQAVRYLNIGQPAKKLQHDHARTLRVGLSPSPLVLPRSTGRDSLDQESGRNPSFVRPSYRALRRGTGRDFLRAFSIRMRRMASAAAAKKCPRLAMSILLGRQPQPRFMDQSGRLKRLTMSLPGHATGGEAPQFLVELCDQFSGAPATLQPRSGEVSVESLIMGRGGLNPILVRQCKKEHNF
jgi:hypothetical protein